MLAGYVDGTLTSDEHRTVEGHLADCDNCREVVAETSLAREAMGVPAEVPAAAEPAGRVVTLASRGRRWWPTMGVLAAAAVITVALVIPRMMRPADPSARPELAELVAAVGEARPFEARLTGGFRYGPLAPVMRSGEGGGATPRPEVAAAVAKLEIKALSDSGVASQAAAAAGLLVAGQVPDAVQGLERVTQVEPGRAAYWSDLAAAYLVRATRTGDTEDHRRALEAADRALALAPRLPEALFNRALALDGLGRADEAREAWDRAVAASDSDWRAATRRRSP